MKARKKKHNPLKRLERAARISCKNTYAVFVGGEQIQAADKRTNQVRPFWKDELEAIGKIRHRWIFYIAIMGVDANGRRYVKGEIIKPKGYYLQDEICGVVSEHHYKLLDSFNKSQLKNAGWIGAIEDDDICPAQAMDIFERAGAFNHTVEIEQL